MMYFFMRLLCIFISVFCKYKINFGVTWTQKLYTNIIVFFSNILLELIS